MKVVMQPPDSNCCGQACVATIAGISLEESIEAFGGHDGKTAPKQVAAALKKLGYVCDVKLQKLARNKKVPTRIILCANIKQNNEHWKHWVVWWDGIFYDPSRGEFNNTRELSVPGVRFTSYLRVQPEGKTDGKEEEEGGNV